MTHQILHIVKLARRGGDWTRLTDIRDWKYVSGITEVDGEITEFEFSADRGDAAKFSRFKAQDVAAATKGTKWYGVPESVVVTKAADALAEIATPVISAAAPLPVPAKAKVCRMDFCKVYLGRTRTVTLRNVAASRKAVQGVTLSGEAITIFLRKGMRIVALATSCKGELVPAKHACRCTHPMAAAVEHSKGWTR